MIGWPHRSGSRHQAAIALGQIHPKTKAPSPRGKRHTNDS